MAATNDPIDTHGHTVADFTAAYPDEGVADIALALSANTDDIVDTGAAHGLEVGEAIQFSALTGGAGLATGTTYYVATVPGATSLTLEDEDGDAVGFTTDITAGTMARAAGSASLAGDGMTLAQSPAEVQAQIDNVPG